MRELSWLPRSGGLAGLGERADTFGAVGWYAYVPGWGKGGKNCDGKLEQGQNFVGIIGKVFAGSLRWSVRLEGHHRRCQQVSWGHSYSSD